MPDSAKLFNLLSKQGINVEHIQNKHNQTLIVWGVFSWLQIEFELTVLAALLAVSGCLLND